MDDLTLGRRELERIFEVAFWIAIAEILMTSEFMQGRREIYIFEKGTEILYTRSLT